MNNSKWFSELAAARGKGEYNHEISARVYKKLTQLRTTDFQKGVVTGLILAIIFGGMAAGKF